MHWYAFNYHLNEPTARGLGNPDKNKRRFHLPKKGGHIFQIWPLFFAIHSYYDIFIVYDEIALPPIRYLVAAALVNPDKAFLYFDFTDLNNGHDTCVISYICHNCFHVGPMALCNFSTESNNIWAE